MLHLAQDRREPFTIKDITQNQSVNQSLNSTSAKFNEDGYDRRPSHLTKTRPISSAFNVKMTLSMMFILVFTCTQVTTAAPQWGHLLRAEREELAHQWAPLVWLHPTERFYPSSVIDFLQYVKPSTPGRGNALQTEENGMKITIPSLPNGRGSRDGYLLASYDTECPNCPLPKHVFGIKPGIKYSPPVYAVIHSCDSLQPKNNLNNPELDYETFLNDDSHYGYSVTPAEELEESFKKQEPSPLNETEIKNNGGETDSSKFTPESKSPSTDNPWNPTIQPLNKSNEPENDMHPLNITSGDSFSIMNTFTTNSSHIQNFQGSTPNNFGDISNDSRAPITTDTPIFSSTVHHSQIVTNQPNYSLSNNSQHAEANIQNDQSLLSQQNTIPDQTEEVQLKIFTKAKKRDVISGSNQPFSVTYWMFYPYNYAKDICTSNLGFFGRILKPTINGVCHGEKIPMGNHFGDWEHITIQFKGRTPIKMYVSSHHFGAYYTYDSHRQWFHYASQDTREGLPLSPNYPLVLQVRGSRPVVYSALGSHGLWAAPGIHQYNSFPHLEDKTAEGTAWKTWQNLEIIDLKYQATLTTEQRHWLSYEGRWGNPSARCHALMGGFCELNDGPTGIPRKRINFPCQR